MLELSACRMCLAVDARMFTIGNTPLQDIYERITSIPLQNEDKRLEKVCYLCHHLLRKTQAFKEKAVTADKRLRQALERGMELTETSMRLLDTSDVRSLLCVSRLPSIDFVQEQPPVVETQGNVATEKYIKVEPIDVKQEIEVEEHSAIAQQYEDENILVLNNDMKTVLQNVGGGIQDERLTMGASMGTTPGEDEANYLQSRFRVSKDEDIKQSMNNERLVRDSIKIEINIDYEENADKETDLLNEAAIISNIKGEGEMTKNLDAIPQNQQGNFKLISPVLNASWKYFNKILFCEQCGIKFKSIKLLNNHTKIDHSVAFICNYCSRVFKVKRSFISHIQTHVANIDHSIESKSTSTIDAEKPHQCSYCNKSFTLKGNLKTHMLIHTKEKPHQCSYCDKAFNNKQHLNVHILTHTGEKPHLCTYCNKGFAQKPQLKEHILTHTGEKPHQCTYCTKAFTTKQQLKRHILTHTGNKPHQCSYCNKGFVQKHHLDGHMLIHTNEKPHQCTYCNKTFNQKHHLNGHLLKHTGEKPYRCTYCNKGFTLKTILNKHILIHTGEKPHQCSYCNKAFTQKQNLNDHILIHTGETPYRCSYCNKGFTIKNTLNKHIMIHTGEKPHQCSHCNKTFTHKQHLNDHMLIHTGEKPHQCSYCNKCFTLKSNLNKHILLHTGVKPHQCSYCDKAFADRTALRNHIRIHTK